MPALLLLAAALGLNYSRHRRGRSTICSTLRPRVGPRAMVAVWAVLTGWFLPHYARPFLRRAARAAVAVIESVDDRPTF